MPGIKPDEVLTTEGTSTAFKIIGLKGSQNRAANGCCSTEPCKAGTPLAAMNRFFSGGDAILDGSSISVCLLKQEAL